MAQFTLQEIMSNFARAVDAESTRVDAMRMGLQAMQTLTQRIGQLENQLKKNNIEPEAPPGPAGQVQNVGSPDQFPPPVAPSPSVPSGA